jgi:hypothetical protein
MSEVVSSISPTSIPPSRNVRTQPGRSRAARVSIDRPARSGASTTCRVVAPTYHSASEGIGTESAGRPNSAS